MDKLTLVICGNSIFNSIQRSALCPWDGKSTNCLMSDIMTSLLCCGSLIYIFKRILREFETNLFQIHK